MVMKGMDFTAPDCVHGSGGGLRHGQGHVVAIVENGLKDGTASSE